MSSNFKNILFTHTLAGHATALHCLKTHSVSIIWPFVDIITLFLVDVCRLFAGKYCAGNLDKCKRPKDPLILYQFEGCPFCRKIRETLSVLSLDHVVKPCPRETLKKASICINSRFRSEVIERGGEAKFPYIIDPNTNTEMYDSVEIKKYLWKEYGSEAIPPLNYTIAQSETFFKISSTLCIYLRPCMDMGILRAPSKLAPKRLELFGLESCCTVRRVREVLDMLEIQYLNHVFPYGDDKKFEKFKENAPQKPQDSLFSKVLSFISNVTHCRCSYVPYLKDENKNTELFGMTKIVSYLKNTYQTAVEPNESWLYYGMWDKKD